MTQKDSLPFGLNSEDIDELTQLLPSYPTHKVVININSTNRPNTTQGSVCTVCGVGTYGFTRNIERMEKNPLNGKPFKPVLSHVCEHCFPTNDTERLVNEMQKMPLIEQIIDAFSGCFGMGEGRHGRKGNSTHFSALTQVGLYCLDCAQIGYVICDTGEVIENVVKKLTNFENSVAKRNSKIEKTLLQQAEHYIADGLSEPFALAIVRGIDVNEVLTLWESKWWNQYPADDILIVSVLTGKLTEADARIINGFRGEHPELAMACIQKSVSIEWATMLLDSGFEEHSDAVRNVLNGADPVITARIRQMEIKNDAIPPSLSQSITLEADAHVTN